MRVEQLTDTRDKGDETADGNGGAQHDQHQHHHQPVPVSGPTLHHVGSVESPTCPPTLVPMVGRRLLNQSQIRIHLLPFHISIPIPSSIPVSN